MIRKMFLILLMAASLSVMPYTSKQAQAVCCGCCTCIDLISDDVSGWIQDVIEINLHIFIQLLLNRQFFWDYQFWQLEMLPAFMNMGEQMAAVGTQQVMIVGTFIDAAHQMEAQQVLQELHARAHKDYHPSFEMCEFGTRVKSLAASERKGEFDALALSERSIDRLLGNTATPAADGLHSDVRFRFAQFQEEFCDIHDEGNRLDLMCPPHANMNALTIPQRDRLNADIDYARVVQHPWTIGLNMTNDIVIDTKEREIFALANNLYGYDTFFRVPAQDMQNDPSTGVSDVQRNYLQLRSVVAKTSVAENSFNALMAMKAEGTPGSRAFLMAYLEQLGLGDEDGDGNVNDEVAAMLGDNPSYYAQMEILTKKAYQTSQFYTNLYDKPANVERKGVAIQAIGLMQKFDLLKSYLRTEASLSVLLELSVQSLQDEIEDAINAFPVTPD